MRGLLRYKLLYLIMPLCLASGCSFTGKFNESIVTAGAASWKVQPLAVRQSYPQWFQNVYLTAEMQTSDIRDWELYLLSKRSLGDVASSAYAELRYKEGGEFKAHPFPLRLVNVEEPNEKQSYFFYTYQFGNDAVEFYTHYQSRRFSFEVKPLDLYYLQPLFSEPIPHNAVIRVEYGILPEYGPKTVGQLMRSMFNLKKEDWQQFCQSSVYIYDKSSACGSINIKEIAN